MITLSKSNPEDIEWLWNTFESGTYMNFQIDINSHFIIKDGDSEILKLIFDMTQENYITFKGYPDLVNLVAHFGNILSIPVGEYDYEVYVKSEIDDCLVSESGRLEIVE